MLWVLGITNDVSRVLQRKDINIVHVVELISDVKIQLVPMRENGWTAYLLRCSNAVMTNQFECQICVMKYQSEVDRGVNSSLLLTFIIIRPRFSIPWLIKFV